tara:strand:+ start:669 stop:893 length:225 start_codon:yes stop_codon:yes gene_type:complete
MTKYVAHFNGGPAHGDVIPVPLVLEIYKVTKVYDTGLCTESKYSLRKVEDNVVMYDLIEERFLKYVNYLERDPR